MLAAGGIAVSLASAVNLGADNVAEANAAVLGMGANCCLPHVADRELTRNLDKEAQFIKWATDGSATGQIPQYGNTEAVH